MCSVAKKRLNLKYSSHKRHSVSSKVERNALFLDLASKLSQRPTMDQLLSGQGPKLPRTSTSEQDALTRTLSMRPRAGQQASQGVWV